MKFGAVRSVRVVKNNDPEPGLWIAHDDGIVKRDLGEIDFIKLAILS